MAGTAIHIELIGYTPAATGTKYDDDDIVPAMTEWALINSVLSDSEAREIRAENDRYRAPGCEYSRTSIRRTSRRTLVKVHSSYDV
jgi:hypothetical protein